MSEDERPPPETVTAAADAALEMAATVPTRRRSSAAIEIVPAGTLLDGSYRVTRTIGRGTMGLVLLARDEHLDRDVAIKLVRPEMLTQPGTTRRISSEARALARVRCPHVIEIHAFGALGEVPYIVMEYVPGEPLDQWLAAHGGPPLEVDQALAIVDQICRGVAAIHAAGLVHRDLKPANVLVGPSFRLVVADLGLARVLDEMRIADALGASGTPAYMAPEVLVQTETAVELAPRADIYSLGVMAYELLVGVRPFATARQTLAAWVAGTPLPSARAVRPELPVAIEEALGRALAWRPEDRTRTADAFRRELLAAAAPRRAAPGMRIVVADDDPDYRELVGLVLTRAFPGVTIEMVADGVAAVAAIERDPPALAIVDLDMPGLNGIEVVATLRAHETARAVPIIVATAIGGRTDWELLARLGAQGFLTKPFDPSQLSALARGIVRRSD